MNNPYWEFAAAVEQLDDVHRKLASAAPRGPEWQAMLEYVRLTHLALRAQDRIYQAAAGGGE